MNNRMCGRERELFIRSSLIDLWPYSQQKLRILIPGIFRTFLKQSPKPHCWGCWGKLKRLFGHLKLSSTVILQICLLESRGQPQSHPSRQCAFEAIQNSTRTAIRVGGEEGEAGVSGSVNHQGIFFPTPSPPASEGGYFNGSSDFRQCTSAIQWFPDTFQSAFKRNGFQVLKTQQRQNRTRKADLKTVTKYHQNLTRKPQCYFCSFVFL